MNIPTRPLMSVVMMATGSAGSQVCRPSLYLHERERWFACTWIGAVEPKTSTR